MPFSPTCLFVPLHMQTKEIKLIDVVNRDWLRRKRYYDLSPLIVCKASAALRL